MKKFLDKNKGEQMHPMDKAAKMNVLGALRNHASSAMGDRLKNLKKVTVASDDPEGLKKGLDMAKKMADTGKMPGDEGSPEEEASESPEEAMSEGDASEGEGSDNLDEKDPEEMTPDELQAQIEKLMMIKKMKEENGGSEGDSAGMGE